MMKKEKLYQLALRIVNDCVALSARETCLLVTDFKTRFSRLTLALCRAVIAKKGLLSTLSLPKEFWIEGALPQNIQAVLSSSSVVLIHTRRVFPHQARRVAAKSGARVLSLCGVTEEIALRALDVDYDWLSAITQKLANMLSQGGELRLENDDGSEFSVQILEASSVPLTGLARNPGEMSALPAGVVAALPAPGTACGRVVFNGSLSSFGLLREPIVIEVERGRIYKITGGEKARKLELLLKNADEGAWYVCEVGLGANPKAQYTGNLIEDERVFGSAHVGLGRNTHLGSTLSSSIHLDGTIRGPRVFLNGQLIASHGELLLL